MRQFDAIMAAYNWFRVDGNNLSRRACSDTASALGIQPRVKSLRSSYTGLYPQSSYTGLYLQIGGGAFKATVLFLRKYYFYRGTLPIRK